MARKQDQSNISFLSMCNLLTVYRRPDPEGPRTTHDRRKPQWYHYPRIEECTMPKFEFLATLYLRHVENDLRDMTGKHRQGTTDHSLSYNT